MLLSLLFACWIYCDIVLPCWRTYCRSCFMEICILLLARPSAQRPTASEHQPNKSLNRIFMKCKLFLFFVFCFALRCLPVVATSHALRSALAFNSHACFMKFKKLPLCRDMGSCCRGYCFCCGLIHRLLQFHFPRNDFDIIAAIQCPFSIPAWWSFLIYRKQSS